MLIQISIFSRFSSGLITAPPNDILLTSMKDTIVCIPTYNESENIPPLLARIFSLYPDLSVVVVDDNSPDNTSQVANDLKSKYPNLHVINREGRQKGFANSYKDGFAYSLEQGFDWILQMDADFSHDPEHIKQMVSIRNGYDFVVGSRYIKGGKVVNWPLKRRVLSRGGNLYARFWLSPGLSDMTGGFNMWHRDALSYLKLNAMQTDGYSFLIELKFHAARAGLRGKEIPITFADRTAAESKMSPTIFREAVFAVPALRIFRTPHYEKYLGSRKRAINEESSWPKAVGY